MNSRSALWRLFLLSIMLVASGHIACADRTILVPPERSSTALPDVGPTSFPSAPFLQVDRVLDPDTAVFLIAREEAAPDGLALLAAKDSSGNAQAITGVVFLVGDDYVSVEYDMSGRPERLASPNAVVRLFDYADASVTLATTDANGNTTSERVDFEPGDLDALRVALPSANDLSSLSAGADPPVLLEKSGAGHSPLEDLIAGGINVLGCIGAGVATGERVHEITPKSPFRRLQLAGGVVMGLLTTVECGSVALRLGFIERYHRELEAAGYVAGCIGGIGGVIGAPLNPVLGVVGALTAAYECPEAAQKVLRLINDRVYATRVSQGFILSADVDLVAGEDNDVTLRLTTVAGTRSLADASLSRVFANLGSVGGEANRELLLRDGVWQWSGRLHPQSAGTTRVLVSVRTRTQTLDLSLRVLPRRNSVEAQIFASKLVVEAGESVEVYVLATGGTEPYRYFWTEQYGDHSAQPMRDLGATSSFSTVVDSPVRYAASVSDALWTYKDAGAVSIEVCGDGECRAGEAALCPADCGDRDAKLCHAACKYRKEVLHCGDLAGVCEAVCTAAFLGLGGNRPCSAVDLEYERCTFSRPALDLGCETLDGGAVCQAQRAASDRCYEEAN